MSIGPSQAHPTTGARPATLTPSVVRMELSKQASVKEARAGFTPLTKPKVASRVLSKTLRDPDPSSRLVSKHASLKPSEANSYSPYTVPKKGEIEEQIQEVNQSSRASFYFTEGSEHNRTLTPLSHESEGNKPKYPALGNRDRTGSRETRNPSSNIRQLISKQRTDSADDSLRQKANASSATAQMAHKLANSNDIKHIMSQGRARLGEHPLNKAMSPKN